MANAVHEVTVRCACDDIEWCIVSRYVADVRYLWFEVLRLRREAERDDRHGLARL